jgi:DNA-binding response OmpR family regulator
MSASSPNILIIEDHILTAELLADILATEGFQTQVALSGREALQRLETFPPDVVYVGCDMPDMDRWGLCLQARTSPGLSRPPMIVALDGPDLGLARTAAVDTWQLPFDIDELCSRLRCLSRPQAVPVPLAA